MNAPTDPKQFRVQLKDAKLFHQQCYIDGQWVDADSRQTIPVTNPATGGVIGSDPEDGRGRDAPRDRGGRPRAAGLAREDCQGARRRSCASGSS